MPQTEWLTKTEIYFLTVRQIEVQNQDINMAVLPPETLPCLFLVSSGWPLIAGAPWPTVTPLKPLPLSSVAFPHVCLSSHGISLVL